MTDKEEDAYVIGGRAVARRIVQSLLKELDADERDHASLVIELDETRAVLRRLCSSHGDNDWDTTLHLADALDKHLGRYLEE